MATSATERRGLHRVLERSGVYAFLQNGLGTTDLPERVRSAYFPELGSTMRSVLDMGCGPASFLAAHRSAGAFSYTGFDPNPKYIETARARFPDADLRVGTTDDLGPAITGTFDLVVAFGVLHHVPDQAVRDLARFAADRLAPGGRFVTFDAVFFDGQRTFARAMARSDRGKFVRTPDAYATLVREGFGSGNLRMDTVHDLLRVPYDHHIVVLERA